MIKITIARKSDDEEVLYVNHRKIIKIKQLSHQTIVFMEGEEILNVVETPEILFGRIKEYEDSLKITS